jgi:hypothetical protein
MIRRKGKHSLKGLKRTLLTLKGQTMKRKRAIITVSLVDESAEEKASKIVQELLDWFREDAVLIPWVKNVKGVTVKDE